MSDKRQTDATRNIIVRPLVQPAKKYYQKNMMSFEVTPKNPHCSWFSNQK